ncbi:MAG: site-specific integrase [Actinobacteria bacterium]|nr:site-specific integrase [Actinomycetota bacterium]
MPVRRGDKWEGRLKIAGKVVSTRRFDTKRSAVEWERRQRTTLDEHGYNPSTGKVSIETLLGQWLEQREGRVSQTTLDTDRYLLPTEGQRASTSKREPVLPTWFRKLHAVKVTPSAIQKWQDDLLKRDLVATTVTRYRTSLSSFFSWCVAEGYISHNPVIATPPPKDRRAREDMRPLPAPEFEEVVRQVAELDSTYSDLVLILGRTGLRWGELRAMQVRGFTETPMPMLHVIRNQPEGSPVKAPKSGKSRKVPIPDYLVPTIRRSAAGKQPTDLLFTSPRGGQLYRTSFVRATSWESLGRGRSLHDLRHTAACEWLIRGVPLTTVQAWLGHGSIQITARYLHHLGDFADRAALDVLNKSASETLAKRARKLPNLDSFGAGSGHSSTLERGRGLSR